MISAEEKRLAEQQAAINAAAQERGGLFQPLCGSTTLSVPPTPHAPGSGSDQTIGAPLHNSCNASAPALQTLSSGPNPPIHPSTNPSVPDRLLHVLQVIHIAHAEAREELLSIIAAIDASGSVTDEQHLRDTLMQLTAHCAALDGFIMDAQLELRFRHGCAAKSLANL